MDEQVLLEESGVTVTRARLVAAGRSYDLNGVTSVDCKKRFPNRVWPILFMVAGLFIFLQTVFRDAPGVITGFGIILLAWWWLRRIEPTFYVVLKTDAGDTKAMQSDDERWTNRVVTALRAAIKARESSPSEPTAIR